MKKGKSFFGKFSQKKGISLKDPNIPGILLLLVIIIVIVILAVQLRPYNGSEVLDFTGEFRELQEGEVSDVMYARYLEALEILEEFESNKASLLNLGYIYRSIPDYVESEKAFRRYLEKNPGDPEALLGIARIYTDQEKYRDAEQKYYEITELFPLYTLAYQNLLELYREGKAPLNQKFVTEIADARVFDEKDAFDEELNGYMREFTSLSN